MNQPSLYMQFLFGIQESALGEWVRGSSWALFLFLVIHTMSMGLLAGTGMAFGVRVLGWAQPTSTQAFRPWFALMAATACIAVVSGVFLVIGYPAKALTNPVFFLKLTLVVGALLLTRRIAAMLPAPATQARVLAGLAIAAWVLAITGGRFLAYTHHILLLSE
ncbi:MAG: hypothetical protein B7Y99_00170 [Caulobacterales bacterium 32-69-10]|nr:MAG: hypothetical protein B7Y99_00170 [Caulobacterales bacterium 32-69-10]